MLHSKSYVSYLQLFIPRWAPFAFFSTISKKKEEILSEGTVSFNQFVHIFWSLFFNSPWGLSSQTSDLPMSLLLVILSRNFFVWKLGHLASELPFHMNNTLVSARLDRDCCNTQMNGTNTKANQHLFLFSIYWTMRLTMFHQNLLDRKMYQFNVAIKPGIMYSKKGILIFSLFPKHLCLN